MTPSRRTAPAEVPDDAALAIRQAVLAEVARTRPRLLDIGAGTGPIGWPFVEADDDYVGVDLSLGMLRGLRRRKRGGHPRARLVQADSARLPFSNNTFDAVLLMQSFGRLNGWQSLIVETCRVLRSQGIVIMGRTSAPANGVDARMMRHLTRLIGASSGTGSGVRDDVQHWLKWNAKSSTSVVGATWQTERSARDFIERYRLDTRFSVFSRPLKEKTLRRLEECAWSAFGSLDATSVELHEFELRIYRF
jgi:SAM-dependent methyltransferase